MGRLKQIDVAGRLPLPAFGESNMVRTFKTVFVAVLLISCWSVAQAKAQGVTPTPTLGEKRGHHTNFLGGEYLDHRIEGGKLVWCPRIARIAPNCVPELPLKLVPAI